MVAHKVTDTLSIEFKRGAKITLIRKKEQKTRYVTVAIKLVEAAFQDKDELKDGKTLTVDDQWSIEVDIFRGEEYICFTHCNEFEDRIPRDCFNLTWSELANLESAMAGRVGSGPLKRKRMEEIDDAEMKKAKPHATESFSWSILKDGDVLLSSPSSYLSFSLCKDNATAALQNLENPGAHIDYNSTTRQTITLQDLTRKVYDYLLLKECESMAAKLGTNKGESGESRKNGFKYETRYKSHLRLSNQRLFEAVEVMVSLYKIPEAVPKSLISETLRKIKLQETRPENEVFEVEFDELDML